jgi:hypothetical protein
MSAFPPSTILIAAFALAVSSSVPFGATLPVVRPVDSKSSTHSTAQGTTMTNHPYLGMWVTKDGRIRQELLRNGRYDEARGIKKSAYQGRYEVRGTHIDYWDDTGFTADGTFVNQDELHHGGMIFYRKK